MASQGARRAPPKDAEGDKGLSVGVPLEQRVGQVHVVPKLPWQKTDPLEQHPPGGGEKDGEKRKQQGGLVGAKMARRVVRIGGRYEGR